MNDAYWELSDKSGSEPVVGEWLKTIVPPIGCKCGNLIVPRALDVVIQREFNCSLSITCLFDSFGFVAGGVVAIVDSLLLDAVGIDHFEHAHFLGSVKFAESHGQKTYRSLVPRSNESVVRVRGGPNNALAFCKICRVFLEYAQRLPFTPYILTNHVTDRLPVYPGESGTLLVRDDVINRIAPFKKSIHMLRVPVVEQPLDGLPKDLSTLPGSIEEIINCCPGWKGHLPDDPLGREAFPCPYCGASLRTPTAKFCRSCKMDWRDSENAFKRV